MTLMTMDEHKAEILEGIAILDPRSAREYITKGRARWRDAWGLFRDQGPERDDCDPMLHHAEAAYYDRKGDFGSADYARYMASWVRTQIVCRIIRDVSECPPLTEAYRDALS